MNFYDSCQKMNLLSQLEMLKLLNPKESNARRILGVFIQSDQ
uniref:Uncharacterized protein n=1 Tax=Brassica oleracea TaxID=3712 RepID=A0A3P6DS88_BRAOL|nr:unnamed protein product [Brassica oleracea]